MCAQRNPGDFGWDAVSLAREPIRLKITPVTGHRAVFSVRPGNVRNPGFNAKIGHHACPEFHEWALCAWGR